MRERRVITLTLLATLASVLSGCASEVSNDVCAAAAAHLDGCLGAGLAAESPMQCDGAIAHETLATDCEQLEAAFSATGDDDKSDAASWERAMSCYLQLRPLSDCVPGKYRGIEVGHITEELVEGVRHPRSGVTIRYRHAELESVVVSGESGPYGGVTIKVPTTALRRQPYFIDVIVDGEVAFTTFSDANIYFYVRVTLHEGGQVSLCQLYDDVCFDLEPLEEG